MTSIQNGPNKPCACGSGLKQKKCHPCGAPVCGPDPEPKRRKESGQGVDIAALSLMMVAGMTSRFR